MRIATLEDAQRIYLSIDRDFKFYGWILALYGSVLSGRGRDIDLLAVPWRPNASVYEANRSLEARLKASMIGDVYQGIMGTQSYMFKTDDNLLIDLQFRLDNSTIKDVRYAEVGSQS